MTIPLDGAACYFSFTDPPVQRVRALTGGSRNSTSAELMLELICNRSVASAALKSAVYSFNWLVWNEPSELSPIAAAVGFLRLSFASLCVECRKYGNLSVRGPAGLGAKAPRSHLMKSYVRVALQQR